MKQSKNIHTHCWKVMFIYSIALVFVQHLRNTFTFKHDETLVAHAEFDLSVETVDAGSDGTSLSML